MKTKNLKRKLKAPIGGSLKPVGSTVEGLKYIADSPPANCGGFHPTTVKIAKDALREMWRLREALLLYHEAWNGCEGNWHKAMRYASRNAERVLWPNTELSGGGPAEQRQQTERTPRRPLE